MGVVFGCDCGCGGDAYSIEDVGILREDSKRFNTRHQILIDVLKFDEDTIGVIYDAYQSNASEEPLPKTHQIYSEQWAVDSGFNYEDEFQYFVDHWSTHIDAIEEVVALIEAYGLDKLKEEMNEATSQLDD